jgi:PIN domain nuclease of toxin-antitoxin system
VDRRPIGRTYGDLVGSRLEVARRERHEGDSEATAVFVSAASEWELAIKAGLGKVSLQRSILQAALEAGFEPLGISFQHAQAVRGLRH